MFKLASQFSKAVTGPLHLLNGAFKSVWGFASAGGAIALAAGAALDQYFTGGKIRSTVFSGLKSSWDAVSNIDFGKVGSSVKSAFNWASSGYEKYAKPLVTKLGIFDEGETPKAKVSKEPSPDPS
jgi:hypothetical protein